MLENVVKYSIIDYDCFIIIIFYFYDYKLIFEISNIFFLLIIIDYENFIKVLLEVDLLELYMEWLEKFVLEDCEVF